MFGRVGFADDARVAGSGAAALRGRTLALRDSVLMFILQPRQRSSSREVSCRKILFEPRVAHGWRRATVFGDFDIGGPENCVQYDLAKVFILPIDVIMSPGKTKSASTTRTFVGPGDVLFLTIRNGLANMDNLMRRPANRDKSTETSNHSFGPTVSPRIPY